MKKLISPLTLILMLAFGFTTLAQSSEPQKQSTIKVKVVEKNDGKTRIVERSYTTAPMSDTEQKEFVDKVLDSLGVNGPGQKQISITVDSNDEDRQNDQDRRRIVIRERAGHDRNRDEPMRWKDDRPTFRFDTEEWEDNVRSLEKEMRPRIEIFRKDMEQFGDRMGNFWTNDVMQAGSVRGLNVYPNNPDNSTLNLRFTAPTAGDVTITVTDTKGKEVGQKVIKGFSGEFVGQVDVKKNTKGTLFVTVVQNEDGAVRKVILK